MDPELGKSGRQSIFTVQKRSAHQGTRNIQGRAFLRGIGT